MVELPALRRRRDRVPSEVRLTHVSAQGVMIVLARLHGVTHWAVLEVYDGLTTLCVACGAPGTGPFDDDLIALALAGAGPFVDCMLCVATEPRP